MLTSHRCKAQERGIMTSSPAWGFARPDSARSRIQSLNSQPLINRTLDNRTLDLQGVGWLSRFEKHWSICHEAVVFLEERDGRFHI